MLQHAVKNEAKRWANKPYKGISQRNMGMFGILPPEIRCMIWKAVWQSTKAAIRNISTLFRVNDLSRTMIGPQFLKKDNYSWTILRVCRALHDEILHELYDFREFSFRLDPKLGNFWMMKDMRKFEDTYGKFIFVHATIDKLPDHLTEWAWEGYRFLRKSFEAFITGQRQPGGAFRFRSRFLSIKIEVLAPSKTELVELHNLRFAIDGGLRRNEGLVWYLSLLPVGLPVQIILADSENTEWKDLLEGGQCYEDLGESDAEAALLPFSSLRDIGNVDYILPAELGTQRHFARFLEYLKSDMETPTSSSIPCELQSKPYTEDKNAQCLIRRNEEIAMNLESFLDWLCGRSAAHLRRKRSPIGF